MPSLSQMGALLKVRERFEKEKLLKNIRIGMALHVTKETAALVRTLIAGGADAAITGCNPLSAQDDVCAALAKEGIKVWAFNMLGLPFETEETIKETIELNKKIKPDKVFISIFYPYPRTELYDLCKKNNWLTNIKINTYFEPISTLNQPTISKEKIEYYYRIFRIAVMYPNFIFIAKILAKIHLSKNTTFYDVIYLTAYKLFSILRTILHPKIKKKLFSFLRI